MKDDEARALGWLSGLLLFLAVGVAAAQTCGCTASARQKAIASTLITVDAACSAYQGYEHAQAEAIIKAAKDEASGQAALVKLRATGDKMMRDCDGAYRAVAVAAQLDNEQTLNSLLTAASIVYDEVKALGLKIPGVSL